ncbi:MAG TPA: NAD(P)/FAD-dependent oxidoreductase [Terricaulis sp.]|nr:NAD(P)/FAD-dependent oxidoreductase [Terricaulis sp.]
MDNTIIVIGAGPVGLTAALRMASLGIKVQLFEKRPFPNRASKAGCFHPPTLEIFDEFGIMDDILAIGQKVDFIQYRDDQDNELALFDCAELADETKYPFRIHLEQAAVMSMLLEKVNARGDIDIRFNTTVTEVRTENGRAMVKTQSAEGMQEHRARAAFVCDGANSSIRESLGVAFEGSTYAERVLRVMTRMDLSEILPGIRPLSYIFVGGRSLAFLKMPDCWRIVTRAEVGVEDSVALSPDYYNSRIRPFLGDKVEKIREPSSDIFSIGKRAAEVYQVGAAFLMGDSAHISSTRGGMNMNCGVHDANAYAYAAAKALESNTLKPLEDCAVQRRFVAVDYLLGRADQAVSKGADWLAYIQDCVRDRDARRAFLRSGLMLDML